MQIIVLRSQVFIRSANAKDLPAVEKLLRAAWHAAYDSIHGVEKIEAISRSWHNQATLKANLDKPWSEFLLADTGETIVGIAYASQSSVDFVKLHQLYVDPASTGKGIGAQLLEECFESFPEAKAFRLEVDEQNPRAAAFYKRFGFRETGRIANCSQEGSGMPAIIMEKRV